MSLPEKEVTDAICTQLEEGRWLIVSRHYPEAHGGMVLHSSNREEKGGKGSIIPDIVARRGSSILFCENKSEFYRPDVEKLQLLVSGDYDESISRRLGLSEGSIYEFLTCVGFSSCANEELQLPTGFYAALVGAAGVSVGGNVPQADGEAIWGPSYGTLPIAAVRDEPAE